MKARVANQRHSARRVCQHWAGRAVPGYRLSARRGLAALSLLLLPLGLAACQTGESFERSTDGATVYLDTISETAKAEARAKIVQALNRGAGAYALGVGDEISILFSVDRKVTSRPYTIAPGDKLRVDFLGDTENSQALQVRPDGRISLPLIGAVMAAGQTPAGLGAELQKHYSRYLTEPKITISVTQSHSPLDDFFDALGASGKSRSLLDKVLPDGTISLPLLPPLQAQGRTLADLKSDIDAAYQAKGLDVSVSLVPGTLRSNATMVIGEVSQPGRIELDRPLTVAMAVARAGGALPTGARSSVRIFYLAKDGAPRVRAINLNDVTDDLKLEDDMIVPANSIIYVPPTDLAKTGRLMNAVLHDILRFQGISIGGGYAIE